LGETAKLVLVGETLQKEGYERMKITTHQ